MSIAILIQAHKNPEQVARLCHALTHPDVDIYLNIDKKSDLNSFQNIVPYEVKYINQRTSVRWGDFSQVEATLQGVREILRSNHPYQYVLYISGQDYPILPIPEILRQIDSRNGSEMIAWIELTPDHPLNRRYQYRHYHFANPLITHTINQFIRTLTPFPRHYPMEPVYKGSPWWCLSSACLHYLLDYCDQHPAFVRFNRTVHCADELFFQTILLHSLFRPHIINDNFRYIDWSAGLANPKILTVDDYEKIITSGKWFARKLDLQQDRVLFDRLDLFRQHNERGTDPDSNPA